MKIQINAADAQTRDVDEEMVREELHKALGRFDHRVTRVEVHVRDVNGPKSGTDKQCTLEARLGGLAPMAATADAVDLAAAVTGAAGKLRRMIQRDLSKRGRKR